MNQQLINSEDRLALKKLVRVMVDLNVTYLPDRNDEGLIIYRLDPPIDVFVHYEGKKPADLPMARFNLRQLIAKDQESEIVRRGGNGSTTDQATGERGVSELMLAYKKGSNSHVPDVSGKDGVRLLLTKSVPNADFVYSPPWISSGGQSSQ